MTSTLDAATNAEYFYDYAGQDPNNNYDLSGQTCRIIQPSRPNGLDPYAPNPNGMPYPKCTGADTAPFASAFHWAVREVERYGRACLEGAAGGVMFGALAANVPGALYGGLLGCGIKVSAAVVERHVPGEKGKLISFGLQLGAGLWGAKLAAEEAFAFMSRP